MKKQIRKRLSAILLTLAFATGLLTGAPVGIYTASAQEVGLVEPAADVLEAEAPEDDGIFEDKPGDMTEQSGEDEFSTETGSIEVEAVNLPLSPALEAADFMVTVNVPDYVTDISFYPATGLADGLGCDAFDVNAQLEAVGDESGDGYIAYTVAIPADISYISYVASDEHGALGGMSFFASPDATITLRELRGYIKNTESGAFLQPGDAEFIVYDGRALRARAGTSGLDETGLYYRFLLHAAGNDTVYTYEAAPVSDAINEKFNAVLNGNMTVSPSTAVLTYSLTMKYATELKITVPSGAVARLFRQVRNYNVREYDVAGVDALGDKTVYTFKAAADSSTTYRVSMPNKITKAGFLSTGVQEIEITYDDQTDAVPSTSPGYTSNTALASRMEDSLLMNVNGQNRLALSQGETFRLKVYRAAWEIVNNDTANIIIEPDFHYELICGHDVVSVTEVTDTKANGTGNRLDITAISSGVAILEVTYDAIEIGGTGTSLTGVYGASDPLRTGLVVIQSGGAANVDFGIESLGTFGNASANWDAEFDTLYFFGDSGSLTFRPSGTDITEVAVSNDKGATWTALSAADGEYTANIVPGNNILRVTTSGGAAYQVVRGGTVSLNVTNQSRLGEPLAVGDTARIRLEGLYIPIPKMGGVYNPGYGLGGGHKLTYTQNGAVVSSAGNGWQYNFIKENYIDVIIPESGVAELTGGHIAFTVMGTANPLGGSADSKYHRTIPESGVGANFGAVQTKHTRSLLPDITIDVRSASVSVTSSVTGAVKPGRTVILAATATGADSYQWYRNTANSNSGGTLITGAIGSTYAPPTGAVGVIYYYCVINGDTPSGTVSVTVGQVYTLNVTNGRDMTGSGPYLAGTAVSLAANTASAGMEFAGWVCSNSNAVFGSRAAANTTVTMPSANITVEATYRDVSSGGSELSQSEIAGYVTMSFEDNGVRVPGESVDVPNALGVIISAKQVPFKQGDTVADVTLRLLDMLNYSYTYAGSTKNSFYLSTISGTAGGRHVSRFGEFSSGAGSGWMVTWNNWFINMGTSEFTVEDGDIIKWQNTCRLGKDIGCDMDKPSAKITGIKFAKSYGTLTPAFGEEKEYIYTVPSSVTSVSLEALQENYWARMTYTASGKSYKPMAAIPVKNGTIIELTCSYSYNIGESPAAVERITITIQVEGEETVETPSGMTIDDLETPLSGGIVHSISASVTVRDTVASSEVSRADMEAALKDALEAGASIIAVSALPPNGGDVSRSEVTLSRASLKDIADSGLSLLVQTGIASLELDGTALGEAYTAASGDKLTLSMAQVKSAAMSPDEIETTGDRPVYDIALTSGEKHLTELKTGEIIVSIPYTLQKNEAAAGITVLLLSEDGTAEQIDCVYNGVSKAVEFKTRLSGRFVIAYNAELSAWANPFGDVSENSWYFGAVKFVSENRLMNGTAADSFSPDMRMSRAMLVTTLYRHAGEPTITPLHSFTDVADGTWYSDAVAWGSSLGIAEGSGNGCFKPGEDITREQLFTILYRYAQTNDLDTGDTANLSGYDDAGEISVWALDAMRWANAAGILTGRTESELAPKETATRAEVATVLMRFIMKMQ